MCALSLSLRCPRDTSRADDRPRIPSVLSRRASLMPATRAKILSSVRATTGGPLPGGALDRQDREDALRAQTSLGFSDSRERGRMPPRLAYIQSATYGRQSATLERGGGEGAAAEADVSHSDASPDHGKPLSFPRRACFPPRLRVGRTVRPKTPSLRTF